MSIRIHSRLMFKYREDLVCQWFFPPSEVFDIILRSPGIHGIMSVEITNHGLQKKKIPRHSQYSIHESRLGFFLYSQITRSVSAESRITQNPFQTLFICTLICKERLYVDLSRQLSALQSPGDFLSIPSKEFPIVLHFQAINNVH